MKVIEYGFGNYLGKRSLWQQGTVVPTERVRECMVINIKLMLGFSMTGKGMMFSGDGLAGLGLG